PRERHLQERFDERNRRREHVLAPCPRHGLLDLLVLVLLGIEDADASRLERGYVAVPAHARHIPSHPEGEFRVLALRIVEHDDAGIVYEMLDEDDVLGNGGLS